MNTNGTELFYTSFFIEEDEHLPENIKRFLVDDLCKRANEVYIGTMFYKNSTLYMVNYFYSSVSNYIRVSCRINDSNFGMTTRLLEFDVKH